MFATAGTNVFYPAFAVEHVAMGIPPGHTTSVRTEAALSMPWAQGESLTALVTGTSQC